MIFVGLVVAIVLVGQWVTSDNASMIEFRIPNGFRGPIILQENPNFGVVPTVGTGAPVYTIPENGKLLVRDFAPFERYHSKRAFYSNGDVLRTTGKSPDDVALRYVGSLYDGSQKIIVHVGNLAEFRELSRQVGVESEGAVPRGGK